jgi:hypothetical protein
VPDAGYTKRRAKWSREDILDAIQRWVKAFGEPPTATDWNPSDARRAAREHSAKTQDWLGRVVRFESGDYPWTGTVWKTFGSWNGAISEAGFTPRPPTHKKAPAYARTRTLDDVGRALRRARQLKDPGARSLALYDVADAALQVAAELESEAA